MYFICFNPDKFNSGNEAIGAAAPVAREGADKHSRRLGEACAAGAVLGALRVLQWVNGVGSARFAGA